VCTLLKDFTARTLVIYGFYYFNWCTRRSLRPRSTPKGRPNKPRIGSSAGKIGKTRVIGAKKVLKDFRRLTKTLQDLMRKYGKGDTKALQKAYKSVRTSVDIKG
jgi:hypothetical protein